MSKLLSYRPDIDGLRAISVIFVILFHADLLWIQGGFIGVDVFFVISGYLITRSIDKEMLGNVFSFKAESSAVPISWKRTRLDSLSLMINSLNS